MLVNTGRINANLLFIISFSLTALVICILNFNHSKLIFQVHHNYIQNVLYINLSFLGSAYFSFGLLLYLFYKKKYDLAYLITASTVITLILVQILKNYFNPGGFQIFFESDVYNLYEPAIQYISSHTALAFSLATVLVWHFNNKLLQFFLILAAFLVSYSRVYLSLHTLPDLFSGCLVGVLTGSSVHYYYLNFSNLRNAGLFASRRLQKKSININNYSIE